MFNVNTLAGNIKKHRIAAGYSQRALADAILVSPQSVSKWECGASLPDVEKIYMIADTLNVSVDTLLGRNENSKKILIGIDGGGSKTEFIAFTDGGEIIGNHYAGTCNPNVIGVDACVEMLIGGINALLGNEISPYGIHVGSAGFLLGGNGIQIRSALQRRYPRARIECATDMLNVIASATDANNCIAAICGTGSSVLVKRGDDLTRLGGYGYLIEKAGSGFDIGRDALLAIASELDGFGEHTLLTELAAPRIGNNVSSIIDKVYKKDRAFVASFAAQVFEAYSKGDKVAEKILTENAKALATLINHALDRFGHSFKVVLSGGIVSHSDVFVTMLKEYLPHGISPIVPKYPQSLGACTLCAKACGVETLGLMERLYEQY